jgi:heme-degrading monooxygenase HmoA
MSFRRVWQFQVKPGQEKEFERVYGPAGDWAQLFRRAPGFEGTELLRSVDTRGLYLTVDRWNSESAFHDFKDQFAEEYQALDKACEHFTDAETNLGDFSSLV